ncbi:hypothetical protein [Alicyclobacillus fodiniaquatilis]|uniref:ABC-2 type transport system permease protein n=1 Tax=Alicyclobacillus fodiniaquatilis TaxID=1661150 RepID=A0ABW4JH98_9BACL
MTDLITVMWKEVVELFSNRRFLLIFTIVVLVMGILPTLHHGPASNSSAMMMFRLLYVLFATVIVVGQTAPDMVLHERVGHTLDYLLTTRLPGYAIFGAKVLISFAVGYIAALLALAIQLIVSGITGGSGWHWLFLAFPLGRVVAFGTTATLSLYVAVIGTFVALRVGEQRAAYLITIFSVALFIIPFLVGWLHFSLTTTWVTKFTIALGIIAFVLSRIGLRLFRREMLVLYLQE